MLQEIRVQIGNAALISADFLSQEAREALAKIYAAVKDAEITLSEELKKAPI